jgi:hypothetical protein
VLGRNSNKVLLKAGVLESKLGTRDQKTAFWVLGLNLDSWVRNYDMQQKTVKPIVSQ